MARKKAARGDGLVARGTRGSYQNENPTSGYQRGDGARRIPGAKAADAANASKRGAGRTIGDGAAAGATGSSTNWGFGIGGNGGVDRLDKSGKPRKGGMPAGDASKQPNVPASLADHVPAHTFATSTLPRKPKAPKRYDPDNDGDNDASPSGDTDRDYAGKNKTKMASDQNSMIKASHKGLFTAKAKAAGMGVQEYANHVLGAKKGSFDTATVRQANFARNFGGGK